MSARHMKQTHVSSGWRDDNLVIKSARHKRDEERDNVNWYFCVIVASFLLEVVLVAILAVI